MLKIKHPHSMALHFSAILMGFCILFGISLLYVYSVNEYAKNSFIIVLFVYAAASLFFVWKFSAAYVTNPKVRLKVSGHIKYINRVLKRPVLSGLEIEIDSEEILTGDYKSLRSVAREVNKEIAKDLLRGIPIDV